jgi:hypothetical protein
MTRHPATEIFRHGDLLFEVEVEQLGYDHPWDPCYSASDSLKLDDVRTALRQGNLQAAAKYARVYRLVPVETASIANTDAA